MDADIIALCPEYFIFISQFAFLHSNFSEITPEGRRITKLDQILLNGNNIAIVSISNMTCLIFFKRCLFLLVSK